MNDKGVQVRLKRNLKSHKEVQITPEPTKKERGIQCRPSAGSCGRDEDHKKWSDDNLLVRLTDKERLIKWLMDAGIITKRRLCPVCNEEMKLTKCDDRSDGVRWDCRRQKNKERHKEQMSIRKEIKLARTEQHDHRRDSQIFLLVESRPWPSPNNPRAWTLQPYWCRLGQFL